MRYDNIPTKVFTSTNDPSILELGCGKGDRQLSSKYSKYFRKNYLGLDIFDFQDSELDMKQTNVLEYNFQSESKNIVLALEILEHIPLRDWDYIINEMKECVKIGGYIVVTTPYMEKLTEYIKNITPNKRYYQIHNVFAINKQIMEYYFPNSIKKRLLGYKYRKKFWLGFYDNGLMTIWKKRELNK